MSKIVHRNKLFKVEEAMITVDNRRHKSHKVIEDDTVVILPITDNGNVLLENQRRVWFDHSTRRMYELPSGHIEKGERPGHAARREFEEETGFKAGKMKFVTFFYSWPGILTKKESLYIAENLKNNGKTHFDEDEDIVVEEKSIDECIDMVKSNKIIDAKTIIALLYYKEIIRNMSIAN